MLSQLWGKTYQLRNKNTRSKKQYQKHPEPAKLAEALLGCTHDGTAIEYVFTVNQDELAMYRNQLLVSG